MSVPNEIYDFTPEQGLTFLEYLAHDLTVAVRIAAGRRQPYGPLSEEQTRNAMYWVNEATHNVVQLTRDLRIGREPWNADEIAEWIKVWIGYQHASTLNQQAIERAIDKTLGPAHP